MSLRRIAGEFSNKDSASRAQKQTKFVVLPRRRLSKRGLSSAKRASRAQKQTKFAVLPRRRLSGRGFGPLEAPCGRRGHPNGGRDTNAPVPLGTPWGAGVRLLSLVVSSVSGRRCAARRLFFANFPFSFCAFGKKSYFCTRVSLIRPAPVESPRQGIEQGYTVVAVRYK